MRKLTAIALIVSAFCSINAFADNESAVQIKWGYTGKTAPEFWGTLSPDFALCASGKSQSPINIPAHTIVEKGSLSINYHAAPFIIVDDGTTSLLLDKTQTIINDGHGIQLNFPATSGQEEISFHQQTYKLIQFHMHTPSENQLQGKTFPLEIHFVHQGANGTVAVIAVFAKIGKGNSTFNKMIAHLPKQEGKAETIQGEQINPADLLPLKQSYYQFDGSLTTPPCTEKLSWLVMSHPITISKAQVNAIKKASNGNNARDIQQLHNRKILYKKM